MAISDDERREVAAWAAESAARVLPLFEALAPEDARPRAAVEMARAFAAGERRSRRLSAVALDAHRAGGEVGDPVGLAVARSASLAAACANIHAETTIGTMGHILGPASYAALARELADGGDPAVGDEEISHAVERAAPTIRALVRRVPPAAAGRGREAAGRGRGRLAELQRRLELALRAEP